MSEEYTLTNLADLAAATKICDRLEKYMEEVLAQNKQFRLQVSVFEVVSCMVTVKRISDYIRTGPGKPHTIQLISGFL